MSTDLLNRLDAIIEVAELEHAIVSQRAGSGNQEYECTHGALEALKITRNILKHPEDKTSERVIGYIINSTVHKKFLGILPLPPRKSREWLHIGNICEPTNTRHENGIYVEHEVVDQIEGTRAEILKAFLQRHNKSQ